MSLGLLVTLFGGTISGWLLKTLHLKSTQLAALDKLLHLKVGTLEDRVNALEAQAVQSAIDQATKSTGG